MDVIYDYETLSAKVESVPVVTLATLKFDQERFKVDPYTFPELVESCTLYKFNVAEQVEKYRRVIDKETLDWWQKVPKDIRDAQLKPSAEDLSVNQIPSIFAQLVDKKTTIWTRGNTFDPVITDIYFRQLEDYNYPYNWWNIRDTRSFIDGLTYGSDISNSFIPDDLKDKFDAHEPRHDIAMDVMRMQYIIRLLYSDEPPWD